MNVQRNHVGEAQSALIHMETSHAIVRLGKLGKTVMRVSHSLGFFLIRFFVFLSAQDLVYEENLNGFFRFE